MGCLFWTHSDCYMLLGKHLPRKAQHGIEPSIGPAKLINAQRIVVGLKYAKVMSLQILYDFRVLTGQAHWLNLPSWPWLHVITLCPCCLFYPVFIDFAICIRSGNLWECVPTGRHCPSYAMSIFVLCPSGSRETVQPAELDVALLTRPLGHTLLVLTIAKMSQPEQPGIQI